MAAIRARLTLGLGILMLASLVGCVSVGVHSTGAASVEDLQAENAYIGVYMDRMAALGRDWQAFAANGSNPGVCNKGGTKQGCFDADTEVISSLNTMLGSLSAAKVPPRFVEADRLLRAAIASNVDALRLRNHAIANNDNTAWKQSGPMFEQAIASWRAAYAAFPADNRPAVAP
jgi:hypothetical protein